MHFENTVTIRRPVEEVFSFLADFENVPKWNYAIAETRKVSEGPVGVGSRYQQVRTIPKPATEGFEVTAYEPESRLSIQGTLGPFQASLEYELAPAAEGTQVTNAVELQAGGALKLVAPLAASRVRTTVAENLAVLKRLLETGSG
jgi:carbon monoxide dehydrogenase subunit G